MPGDYTLNLEWPTCGFDNQKCTNYLSRCDQCSDKERRISLNRWAIVTNDCKKAKAILQTIVAMCDKGTVIREVYTTNDMFVETSDGTLIRWWGCYESTRTMKCSRLWCDENIDIKFFETVINPNYFGTREDIIWI